MAKTTNSKIDVTDNKNKNLRFEYPKLSQDLINSLNLNCPKFHRKNFEAEEDQKSDKNLLEFFSNENERKTLLVNKDEKELSNKTQLRFENLVLYDYEYKKENKSNAFYGTQNKVFMKQETNFNETPNSLSPYYSKNKKDKFRNNTRNSNCKDNFHCLNTNENTINKIQLNDFINNGTVRKVERMNNSDLLLSDVGNLNKVSEFFKIEGNLLIEKEEKILEHPNKFNPKGEKFYDSYFYSPNSK